MTDRLLTRREVERITGLSRSTLYQMMTARRFPRPLQVGSRAVRWRESEIIAWIDSRHRTTGDAPGA